MLLATAPCYVKQYVNTNPCTLFKCCLSSLTGIFQMLLSGDETLQTASAKCIAAVLAHSSSQGSTPFIKADVPGDMHTQTHKHSGGNMLAIQAVAFFDFFSSTNKISPFESLFISLTVSFFILICLFFSVLYFNFYLFVTFGIVFVFVSRHLISEFHNFKNRILPPCLCMNMFSLSLLPLFL